MCFFHVQCINWWLYVSGTTIYPITKVKVKKSGKFTLIKTNSDCTNRFVQRYPFLYALESAVSADSGTYQWRVIDCKKQEYGGVFILNVIQGTRICLYIHVYINTKKALKQIWIDVSNGDSRHVFIERLSKTGS